MNFLPFSLSCLIMFPCFKSEENTTGMGSKHVSEFTSMVKNVNNIIQREKWTLTLIRKRQRSLWHHSSAQVQHRRLLSASPQPLELSTSLPLYLSLPFLSLCAPPRPPYFPSAPSFWFTSRIITSTPQNTASYRVIHHVKNQFRLPHPNSIVMSTVLWPWL